MQKKLTFLALWLLTTSALLAQISIFGQINLGESDGPPMMDWPVQITDEAGNLLAEAATDVNGNYDVVVEIELDGPAIWLVSTFDLCFGNELQETIEPGPLFIDFVVDFVICEDVITPPDPPCSAHFYQEQQLDDPLTVQFYDTSFPGEDGINTWSWEFGDGGSSTEQSPAHTYTDFGLYTVTLTIEGDSCLSTAVQEFILYDPSDCDCPTDEYVPVCVVTPAGTLLEFTNACYAECAGYNEDQYQLCYPDCGCPEFYAPVCVALPNGVTLTFDNHCFAECEGYGPDQWVECEVGDPCDDCDDFPGPPVCVFLDGGEVLEFTNACYAECEGFLPGQYQYCDGSCYCPDFYAPVCVILDDGTELEFDNFCFAECEGYGPDQWTECDPCICPDVYDPVCVTTPIGVELMFDNACQAECAGFGSDVYYACEGTDCGCPEYWDPVCVIDASGNQLQFSNPCFAECEGYGPDQYVTCDDCICTDEWDPVCVATDFGIITFGNACEAECAGFTPEQFLDSCPDDCICDDIYDPVCVELFPSSGLIITFINACEAECHGFGPDQYVECDPEPCDCIEIYAPVCVMGPDGTIITFTNSCYAECDGYTPADFVECDDLCNCTDEWDPVCVNGFAGIITFPNACEAECAGFSEADFVDCENECECYTYFDPVCVLDSLTGEVITFTNECYAECEGYTAEDFVECSDCECDPFPIPICVIDPATGEVVEFENPCLAVCAGYDFDDLFNCSDNPYCYADYTYTFSDDTEAGFTVLFTDLSFVNEGEITSWLWDFGDGNTSEEQNPVHTYTEAGVYDVVLTIETDNCGTLSTLYHLCVGDGGGVGSNECQAFFFFEQPNPDDLLTFQFIDLSFGNVTAWVWDFGDGTLSTEQNPIHTYADAGDYSVSLTIFGEDCQNTVIIPVTVGENIWYGDLECRAWFLPIINAEAFEVFFINLSSSDIVDFVWDYGDGSALDNNPLPIHTYPGPGTYTASLTTTNADGCTNTFAVTFTFGNDEDDDGFTAFPTFALVSNTQEVEPGITMKVAPNPTRDIVQVQWDATEAGSYSWTLHQLDGRVLQRNSLPLQSGKANLSVDLSAYPAGIYLLRIQTPSGQQTLRVSKL